MEDEEFQIGLKIITRFLQVEMERKVVPNRRNYMSKSQSRKAWGVPEEWNPSNATDLRGAHRKDKEMSLEG